jgi:hypothetical protein
VAKKQARPSKTDIWPSCTIYIRPMLLARVTHGIDRAVTTL